MTLRGAMIYVKDFPRMRDFYAALLGVAPHNTEWTDMWAEFATGEAAFCLHAVPRAIAEQIEIATPPLPREEVPVKLTLETADLRAARARIEALGAAIVVRGWQQEHVEFDLVDPEGNIVCIRCVRLTD
ncbi:MAG: hypothetical protein JST93_30410 [Acidobacteria bacterium]|nr:hypothetical protein [Acidobacteriota bacterium]